MVKKKEKITFLKKNRHKIRIYSFILLHLQYQKIKEIYIIDFSILNLITKFKDYGKRKS